MNPPVALVAEDEALIRMDASDVLRDAGYEVLEASHADEALVLIQSRPEVIFMITDVEMPDGSMDGLTLANEVHRRFPHVEIIVCSGRVKPGVGALPAPVLFLGKPVDHVTLLEKARQTIRRRQSDFDDTQSL